MRNNLTRSVFLTGLLLCVANNRASLGSPHGEFGPRLLVAPPISKRLSFDLTDTLACGEARYYLDTLAQEVGTHQILALQGASIFSSLREFASEEHKNNEIDNQNTDSDNSGFIETRTTRKEGVSIVSAEFSENALVNPSSGVFIVGSGKTTLDYTAYADVVSLDIAIHLSDTVVQEINIHIKNKLGIALFPDNNVVRLQTAKDLDMMMLLLSLGGNDGRNFIHLDDPKQKAKLLNTDAWLAQTDSLRSFAVNYLDAYKDSDSKAELFEHYYLQMPGIVNLLIQSHKHSNSSLGSAPDHLVRFEVCRIIKKETKRLWVARLGKKIGL